MRDDIASIKEFAKKRVDEVEKKILDGELDPAEYRAQTLLRKDLLRIVARIDELAQTEDDG